MAFLSDGWSLLTDGGGVQLWDLEKRTAKEITTGGMSFFMPNISDIVVEERERIKVVDLEGRVKYEIPSRFSEKLPVAMKTLLGPLPDGRIAGLGTKRLVRDNFVVYWDPATGELATFDCPVMDLKPTLSPDGRYLAECYSSERGGIDIEVLRVWSIPDEAVVLNVEGRFYPRLYFTPDSRQLVASAEDGRVKSWELKAETD